jgi:hypothetical protein
MKTQLLLLAFGVALGIVRLTFQVGWCWRGGSIRQGDCAGGERFWLEGGTSFGKGLLAHMFQR